MIVQVRKLGEGFDHRFLAVAAVFSIFSNLSPFVQFVGRIMRVINRMRPATPEQRRGGLPCRRQRRQPVGRLPAVQRGRPGVF